MPDINNIFNVPANLVVRNYGNEDTLPEYRSELMRDRDRLMYATAFRRLSGKTQIYTVGKDDHKKNRLTHTLEVAQIARTIAVALKFNPDLAEAIALGHDFGHTPFGHAGERMLHEIMIPNSSYVKRTPFYQKDITEIKARFEREAKEKIDSLEYIFGFKHNLQSVRVAAVLEDSYRNEKGKNVGLNLTNFTLYGMMVHSALKYETDEQYPNFQDYFNSQMMFKGSRGFAWSFEAYIVKWADDIAQWHHDLEDAMREGVLPLKTICGTIQASLKDTLSDPDKNTLREIKKVTRIDRRCIAELSHIVVNTLINDLVETSKKNLERLKNTLEQKKITNSVRIFEEFDQLNFGMQKDQVITISKKIKAKKFKKTINSSIHYSRNVERMNEKGKYIIRKLFEAYYAHPQQLPDGPILHLLVDFNKYPNIDKAREKGIGKARVLFDDIMENPNIYYECMLMRRISDHIASMTDRYAIEEYNNLYG